MARAIQRKDGIWCISVTENGHRRRYYGKTERDVWSAFFAEKEAVEHGPIFSAVADMYESQHFEALAYGSLRSLRPALKRAVERFADNPIKDISPNDISVYVKWLEARYAYKTVKNHLSVLKQVFDFAIVELDAPIHNPCDRIRVSNTDDRETREPPTEEQVSEIKSTRSDEFLLGYVILYTGCRLGEALALQVNDIDTIKHTISISRAVHFKGNTPYIGQLKTKKSKRTIPYLKPLEEMVEQLDREPTDYIVSGAKLPTLSAVNRRWAYFCLNHNMAHREERQTRQGGKTITINEVKADIDRHQLRHYFATMCFEAGIDVKSAQEILGHSDYKTTMNIYTHWRESRISEATQKLNDAFAPCRD